jgi:NCS1 family nucleobase:cation symporter-1
MTDFGGIGGLGDLLRLLDSHVFTGKVHEGESNLTWIHVAAFAWMCNLAYHAGLTDMSIFRYAKRKSYGWVGLYGMYVGHFFAWTCAGIMGATAAALCGKDLRMLDSGAVAGSVLGITGLMTVVAAGWTTATPNIYRAALSFATFAPKTSLRKLSFAVGAVIAICACFPVVMRIDKLVNAVVLVLPSVGAVCLTEHWIFPRIGLVRYWNLYRGRKVNWAATGAWLVSAIFVLVSLKCGWMHSFFLFLPAFLLSALSYVVFAWLSGAGRAIPGNIKRDVDAVESRIVEIAESECRSVNRAVRPVRPHVRIFGVMAAITLAVLVAVAVIMPDSYGNISVICTILYFVFALAAASGSRKQR